MELQQIQLVYANYHILIWMIIIFLIVLGFVWWLIKETRKEAERQGWNNQKDKPSSLLGGLNG